MKGMADIYTQTVHRHLKPLFANWEPGADIKLGHYGRLSEYTFEHLGNVTDWGLTFDIESRSTSHHQTFSSDAGVVTSLTGRGSAGVDGARGTASLGLTFKNKNAVF